MTDPMRDDLCALRQCAKEFGDPELVEMAEGIVEEFEKIYAAILRLESISKFRSRLT